MKEKCMQMKGKWKERNAHWNEHERNLKGKCKDMNTNIYKYIKGKWKDSNAEWKEDACKRKENQRKLYQCWPQTEVEKTHYILVCGKGYHFGILPCIYCPRETSVNSCGPRNPEWETSVGNKCGRQVWETSVGDKYGRQVGDKCKLMRPKTSRVGDMCGRRVGHKCKIMRPKTPRMGDKCGRQGGDKCKLMWPKEARVGDKCGRQVGDKCKISHSKTPRVGDKRGRQVENKCK